MNKTMSKRYKITLSIFVIVTITAGLFGYLLDQVLTDQPEGSSLGMGLWLVLPCLTGIVLGIINKDLKQIGVKPNFKHNLKRYAVSIFVFPCVMLINIIVAKMTGGLTVGEIELSTLFILMISSFAGSFVKNIFEVIGEAFITNELFHEFGDINDRKELVMKYMDMNSQLL